MSRIINYLRDPRLVLAVQRYFGITGKNSTKKDDDCVSNSLGHGDSKNSTKTIENGSVRSTKKQKPDSNSPSDEGDYIITNLFWYYLFVFGTELGDEIFYATFIPFWFWNVDGAVGRRVVMVWTIIMYIGQGIKDIVCWPRPASPPVHRLQKKWVQEYGMPSTHAMVGISIPFSVVLYTMNRYQYPLHWGLVIAVLWCSVMCMSRIYLGMHSVLDIIAGLVLALVLMVALVPAIDSLDRSLVTSHWSPPAMLLVSTLLIAVYPQGSKDQWTPTKGDTTVVVSVCVGVMLGSWTNYQLGQMSEPQTPPPYEVIWPSYEMIGVGALRTSLGLCGVVATRAICKSVSYALTQSIFRWKNVDSSDVSSDTYAQAVTIERTLDIYYKYLTYGLIGFNIVFLLPAAFRVLSIERPTFYTEL
ncbi:sphingosine-1-phosphate phosphatase 2 [Nilaparvata lugens]|uniref:sphingosine-1-phosphate phosphatase 2 n=1 Tax=Nilaparvata lugens TaxID=108931 RepID=UPI00193E8CE9|nr:sphingosine-1-phosphate phosphatase 2 [Nilaparvata lugens]